MKELRSADWLTKITILNLVIYVPILIASGTTLLLGAAIEFILSQSDTQSMGASLDFALKLGLTLVILGILHGYLSAEGLLKLRRENK